jgi:hypothetical protein
MKKEDIRRALGASEPDVNMKARLKAKIAAYERPPSEWGRRVGITAAAFVLFALVTVSLMYMNGAFSPPGQELFHAGAGEGRDSQGEDSSRDGEGQDEDNTPAVSPSSPEVFPSPITSLPDDPPPEPGPMHKNIAALDVGYSGLIYSDDPLGMRSIDSVVLYFTQERPEFDEKKISSFEVTRDGSRISVKTSPWIKRTEPPHSGYALSYAAPFDPALTSPGAYVFSIVYDGAAHDIHAVILAEDTPDPTPSPIPLPTYDPNSMFFPDFSDIDFGYYSSSEANAIHGIAFFFAQGQPEFDENKITSFEVTRDRNKIDVKPGAWVKSKYQLPSVYAFRYDAPFEPMLTTPGSYSFRIVYDGVEYSIPFADIR